MRNLLLLALLLYNIVYEARSENYDYDDIDGRKRPNFDDNRRLWRKKGVMKPLEQDHKEWDDRRRHDYESSRYLDELDAKGFGMDRQRAGESSLRRRYEDMDKLNMAQSGKSSELEHPAYMEKELEKKLTSTMNCDRPHERYETCFAGCAAVTCDNPRDRLRPCYPFCEPGCICLQPYVRDDRTHKCVLPEDCSKSIKGIPDLADET